MDKTLLVNQVAELMALADHDVRTSVRVGSREIDVVAEERSGISRKTLFIECADYSSPVGVEKVQSDLTKLRAAQEEYQYSSHLMHVARNGYTTDANSYIKKNRVDAFEFQALVSRLMNFDGYVRSVQQDPVRRVIMDEYQATAIHPEGDARSRKPALSFLEAWLDGDEKWLTVLGDYGVGKSWMLKRLLYKLIDEYAKNPKDRPIPLFVPLQYFTKSFDFETLVTTTLQRSGVTTVNYKAFEYLAAIGRVIFLLDSFDEMAQTIRPDVIRANLASLLIGVSNGSKAILTSRPTYFESRAERLVVVEKSGDLAWDTLDRDHNERRTQVADMLAQRLSTTSYARLNDLTAPQRQALFSRVLQDKPFALAKLDELHKRFTSLGGVSQRAVIARLLTTVAETLADNSQNRTIDGYDLVPEDLQELNEAKIFDIVIANLLLRDINSGGLTFADRRKFLRSFAVYLQRAGTTLFASPEEIRRLVGDIFKSALDRSDAPQADLENYYRTCRRHSGLTTERQFLDTSGAIDTPVDDTDHDSPVGFSHNSIREFLVADSIAEYLTGNVNIEGLHSARITEAVAGFLVGLSDNNTDISAALGEAYATETSGTIRQWLFFLILGFLRERQGSESLLGSPPVLRDLDLSGLDMSGLKLFGADFSGSLILETNLSSADLREANFDGAILERTQLDAAQIKDADFRSTELNSIYVHDPYIKDTISVLDNQETHQWLFSTGALVSGEDQLNQFLGKPWYDAAREVAVSLKYRLAGTHRKRGLIRGTRMVNRALAAQFTDYLLKRGVLVVVRKNRSGGDIVVQVVPEFRSMIVDFADSGLISEQLEPFFKKFTK